MSKDDPQSGLSGFTDLEERPTGGLFRPFLWLRERLGDQTAMLLVALLIGIGGGLGAVAFRYLIGGMQTLAWGSGGTELEKVVRAPWWQVLIVPAAGGLLVGLIVKFFAPEAKGHGVPEVMLATARNGGVIRPIVAVAKSFASAICIATGGSVGREGPIVQIGSSLGSSMGQMLKLSSPRLRICVGCGAAAGIAATFNAPIAGAFFAAEIILGGFAANAFGPLVVSSVVATVISRSMLGDIPAFTIPHYSLAHPAELSTYVVLGVLAAVVAVAFVKVLYWMETAFERMSIIPDFLQPVLGGLGIGLLALAVPQIMGVGYDTIEGGLRVQLALGVLLAVLGAKLLASALTLGSGGSGGVFAPSLFLGATLGAALGLAAQAVVPWDMGSPGAYAVVGMGAVVAATTHAPITAILIIFELTGDYRVILPLMLSCILSTLIAQLLQKQSIYTIKLFRRGIDLQQGREVNVLRSVQVEDVLRPEIETVPRNEPLKELYRRMVESDHYEFFTVDAEGKLVGVISIDDLRHALPLQEKLGGVAIAEDVSVSPVFFLRENDTLDRAMRQFGRRTMEELPVLPAGNSMVPVGTVRRQDIINAYNKEILKVDLAGGMSDRLESATTHRTWETVGGHVMALIEAPASLCNTELSSLRLRQEHGVQIILVERANAPADERFAFPSPETVLEHGDKIIVFGAQEAVEKVSRLAD